MRRAIKIKRELEAYFAKTPREQIVKDWEKTAKYDKEGIIVAEFMEFHKKISNTVEMDGEIEKIINDNFWDLI